jgi:short subunit dehydrogenase-like uncharacterized protein
VKLSSARSPAVASSQSVVLYGTTGYTGRLVLAAAQRLGLKLILAGRHPEKVARLAREAGMPSRIAEVNDPHALETLLEGVGVLLNAAGPFSRTAAPLMAAALRAGVHYLDVAGEVDVFVHAAELDRQARAADVMLMPGVGFDVVPTDCLAAYVTQKLPGTHQLHLGISGLRHVSRGSARTLVQHLGRPIRARRGGQLVTLSAAASEHYFDFGAGRRPGCAVDWGDIVSAYYSTGVPNVTTYFERTAALQAGLWARQESAYVLGLAPVRACLEIASQWLPEGPTALQRSKARTVIVAEAEAPGGRHLCARLETPDVYDFTADCAALIASRVALGSWERGFQTPARVFGSEFVLHLPDVVRHDLSARN